MILLAILLIIAVAVALFYRSKAKEFESLFELSKGYGQPTTHTLDESNTEYTRYVNKPKLNKDGSIAKKRGRKSNAKTT